MIENPIQLDACVRRIRDALDAAGWRGGVVVALPEECAEDAPLIAQELSLTAVDIAEGRAAAGADVADLVRSAAQRPCAGTGIVLEGLDTHLASASPAERQAVIETVLRLETPHAVVVAAVFAAGELPKGVRRAVKVELPKAEPRPGLYDISLI